MRPDIVNLRQFYSSRLGRKVRRRLRGLLRDGWGPEGNLQIVGVGYTAHLLPLPDAPAQASNRIVALMPTAQGAIYWPIDGTNHSVLGDEMRPPMMPSSLHRVLMVHAIEHCAAPDELLKIWWQLLAPGGRLVLVVPSRHGLWARFGQTPFATGKAYSFSELKKLCNDVGFTLREARSALFGPPSSHPIWLACFAVLEWLGAACFPRVGGVYVIEAEKQIYAGVRESLLSIATSSAWKPAAAMTSPRHQQKDQ